MRVAGGLAGAAVALDLIGGLDDALRPDNAGGVRELSVLQDLAQGKERVRLIVDALLKAELEADLAGVHMQLFHDPGQILCGRAEQAVKVSVIAAVGAPGELPA